MRYTKFDYASSQARTLWLHHPVFRRTPSVKPHTYSDINQEEVISMIVGAKREAMGA